MELDLVARSRAMGRDKRFDPWLLVASLLLAALTIYMYRYCYRFTDSDIYAHANIAADFDFTDLHSITSRLAYPMWHLVVATLHKLGVPLVWAAGLVGAACKVAGLLLTRAILRAMLGEKFNRNLVTAIALALMLVMGVRISSINPYVYRPVGAPNVWHNPTQVAVVVTMLLLVPYTMHCWYDFARRRDAGEQGVTLGWRKAAVLFVISMASLATKPTFMQAFLPAAAILFAVEWARDPKQWRFFTGLVGAFLPAALYFLLQYLYYTGVVVPFSSGVLVELTADTARQALTNALIQSACPLVAVAACYRRGMFKDRQLVLCLLMVAVSTIEGMLFQETGMRIRHGNFFWAGMTASLMLWVEMAGVYTRDVAAYLKSDKKSALRGAGYALVFALFLWHLVSGIAYPISLVIRGSSF